MLIGAATSAGRVGTRHKRDGWRTGTSRVRDITWIDGPAQTDTAMIGETRPVQDSALSRQIDDDYFFVLVPFC